MLFGHLLPLAAIATAATIKHKPDSDYVFSCGPPLPYLANGSQATSWAQYLDEIGDDLDGDGQGAVDHFGGPIGKAPLKWPRNSENIAVIPYCYFDEKERESMHEVIEAAIQSWMTYLGNPGKESGHAISFEEWVDSEGKPVICYKKSETDFFHWNPDLPHETLTIQVGKGETGWTANAGLAVDQKSPWRNQLNGPESGRLVNVEWAAMHELGHVMGMAHEHQRSDRDDYIVVKPEKIGDFEECYKRAHEKSSRVTRENVCTSLRVALRNNCACRDWVKGMAELYLPLFTFDKYDPESIMHYPSAIGGKQEKCELYSGEEDTAECPIQQYKNFEDHSQGTTKMTPNLHPSAQDIAWVKKVYAWDEKGEA